MFDVLIKNGTIVDGSGSPVFPGDVGIKEEVIKKIGDLRNEKGEKEIDARGKFISPGFIDVNNHSDTFWRIFLSPDLESLVCQGITTIIGGNCGSSLAPLIRPEAIESIQKWTDVKKINVNWLGLSEFFDFLEKKKLSVNFGTLTGHATLRRGIIGDEARGLSFGETELLRKIFSRALKDGSLGLSVGLAFSHAKPAPLSELTALSEIAKKNGKIFVIHLRNEGENILESVEEALKISRESGARLHISHLKVAGQKNWPLLEQALSLLEESGKFGPDVSFDVYPYTYTGTVLHTLLPDWITEGGRGMMLNRLRDPELRAKAAAEMKESEIDFSKMEISVSSLSKTLARRKISEIAKLQNKSPEETIIELLIVSEGRTIIFLDALSEENVKKEIVHPFSVISTNGAGYDLEHRKTGETVHPRSFGTFPRTLSRYVFGNKIISLEAAIRKMTGHPAERFGLKKRGLLKKGYFADVNVIDGEKIKDLATRENPYQYCRGIDYVLVNGQIVLDKGEYTGAKNGELIRN